MKNYVSNLEQVLNSQGVSRRSFLQFCSALAASMALPAGSGKAMAAALSTARRPSVIWLSFQECTGCTESLTRSHSPSIENLIFNAISLDYHHTLQAASGHAAELAREEAMQENYGKYILVVDGSIPTGENGNYSTIAGISNLQMLKDTAKGASAIVAVGSCAAFGGLPMANPNPTGAKSVLDIVSDKPVINIPGCPPIPVVITGVIAHVLAFGLPKTDDLNRPVSFYGNTIHDRCYRRPFYEKGLFAESFDDEGAKKGWCLYKLGCKGPITYNACATAKWNNGAGFPIEAGHGCIGCSEPSFWDIGGFYDALSSVSADVARGVVYGAAAGIGAGVLAGALNRAKRSKALKEHNQVKVEDIQHERD